MSGDELAVWVALFAGLVAANVWALSQPVSDPAFSHGWEAEAVDYAARIRPGDHWGR